MPINFTITGDNKGFLTSMDGVRNSVRSTMSDVEKAGMSVEQMFDRIKQAAALSFAGISVKELIGNIMDVRGQFQQLEVAFKTILGSEQAATKLMDQLVKTAATTPFDLKGVADGAKMLLAYGTEVEKVNDMLVRLGDVAAGMSIPLSDLVYLYGTTMVQGRMFTQDLRQFQGRGIPIAEELAKVLHVTTNEIGDMVTAGKVTGEVFHQAFMNMTDEGSKFGGLMAEQSKTIQGQISNIEDAVDMMFNEWGKQSEGVINAGLSGVSYMVENWQKVGEAIGVAAVAIGSYKAVMIAVNAVQKAHSALMAESAVQTALAAAAGHSLTAAQAKQIAMDNMLTVARQRLVLATKELAAATLLNPYVWAAAAITGLVVLTYKLATAEDAETAARRRANSEIQEFSKKLDEQRNQIQGYIQTIQDVSATEYEKAVAWEMLNKLAPTLTEKYSRQEMAVLDLAVANKELKESQEGQEYDYLRKKADEFTDAIRNAEEQITGLKEAQKNAVNGEDYTIQIEQLQNLIKGYEANLDVVIGKIVEVDRVHKQMAEDAKPIEVKIQEANENVSAKKEIYDFYRQAIDLAGELKSAHDEAAGTIGNSSIPYDYNSIADNVRQKYNGLILDLQNDVEELRRKVASSPADIKLQIELEEKQKALDDIISMKAQWEATGATTIPLFFQIHYTEAENALGAAKSGAREGMRFDGPTGTWVRDELAAPKKTPAQYKAEAYAKWKTAEKTLNDFYQQKDEMDQAAFDKKVEELQSSVEEAKKQYQKYGGSTSKSGSKSNDAGKRRAAIIQEERRWQEQMNRILQSTQEARSETRVASIIKDGEREREEQEHQHRMNLRDIENQAEEMKKALYEHNKRVWESSHKDGVYEDTAEGKAGWSSLALTKEQQDYISAMLKKENQEYKNIVQQRYLDEAQAMYDYLKEYGTYEQQKLAITEEYERKILNARTQGERLSLQKQRDSALAKADAQSLAMNIDWTQTFKGIGNILKDVAKETLGKVNEYMKTEEFKRLDATDKQAYVNLRDQLKDAGGQEAASPFKASTWADIARYTEEYKERVRDFMKASNTHRDAVARLQQAQKEYNDAVKNGASVTEQAMKSHAVELAQKWADETAEQVKSSDSEKNEANEKLHTATDAASQGLENFNTVLGQLTSGTLTGFFDGVSNVIASLTKKTSDDMQGIVGIIGEKAGGIIGAILQIIDALGEDPAAFVDQILDKVASVIQAVIEQIPEIIASVVSGAANIVGSVFSGIGNLLTGGALFGNGNVEENEKEIAELRASNDNLKKSIDELADAVQKSTSTNEESINAYKEQLRAEKEWEANQRKAIDARASEWSNSGHGFLGMGGEKSFNYYMPENYWDGWRTFSQILSKYYGSGMGYEHRSVNRDSIWNLTPEEMKLLQAYAPAEWASLMNGDGESNPIELINEYIERAGEIQELTDQLNRKLTGYTFEGFADSYKDILKDLTSDTQDFGDKIEEIISNAMIESLVNEEFRERIQKLYQYIAEHADDGLDATELDWIRKENKDIADKMIARRQNLIDSGLIKPSEDEAYRQQASAKGFAAMSQDTGEELNGRFTALQISNEAISQQMIVAVACLNGLTVVCTSIDKNVAEIRGLVFTSTGYLEDVVKYAKLMYQRLGGSLEDIVNNTKNL